MRVEHPNGSVAHLEGGLGEERVVRLEEPDGTMLHYVSARGSEQLARIDESSRRT